MAERLQNVQALFIDFSHGAGLLVEATEAPASNA
jgi:hypothetical protein